MQTMKQAAAEFLAGKRLAVTGISRNPQSHGSNVVYQRLRQRGYQVFAVNPNASKLGFGQRALLALGVPAGDFRDWAEITEWAKTIAGTIGEEGSSDVR